MCRESSSFCCSNRFDIGRAGVDTVVAEKERSFVTSYFGGQQGVNVVNMVRRVEREGCRQCSVEWVLPDESIVLDTYRSETCSFMWPIVCMQGRQCSERCRKKGHSGRWKMAERDRLVLTQLSRLIKGVGGVNKAE